MAFGYNCRQVILGMGEKLVSDRFADAREDDSFTPRDFISRYNKLEIGADDFNGLSFIGPEWTGNIAPALNFSQLSRLVNGNSFLFSLLVNLEVVFSPKI